MNEITCQKCTQNCPNVVQMILRTYGTMVVDVLLTVRCLTAWFSQTDEPGLTRSVCISPRSIIGPL